MFFKIFEELFISGDNDTAQQLIFLRLFLVDFYSREIRCNLEQNIGSYIISFESRIKMMLFLSFHWLEQIDLIKFESKPMSFPQHAIWLHRNIFIKNTKYETVKTQHNKDYIYNIKPMNIFNSLIK